ncbi:MAG: hypothetical protein CR982_08665 [Candidatus Cloacimonadota bacterium]|nr:MAG: hypothetical protein CR982_08665 [Candidatus Cloacimonadota bacterium]PIE78705.1 MAG: hypothetical protein CSA15_06590 [Candidatus Delongbacteria bacterium]
MKKIFVLLVIFIGVLQPLLSVAEQTKIDTALNSGALTSEQEANPINDQILLLKKLTVKLEKKLNEEFDKSSVKSLLSDLPVTEKNIDERIKGLEEEESEIITQNQVNKLKEKHLKIKSQIEKVRQKYTDLNSAEVQLQQLKEKYLNVKQLIVNPVNNEDVTDLNRTLFGSLELEISTLEKKLKLNKEEISQHISQLEKGYDLLTNWRSAVLLKRQRLSSTTYSNLELQKEEIRLRDEIESLQNKFNQNHGSISVVQADEDQKNIYEKQIQLWLVGFDKSLIKLMEQRTFDIEEVPLNSIKLNALEEQYLSMIEKKQMIEELREVLEEKKIELKKYVDIRGKQPLLENAFSQREQALLHQRLLLKKEMVSYGEELNKRRQEITFSLDELYKGNNLKSAFKRFPESLKQMRYQFQISFQMLIDQVKEKLLLTIFLTSIMFLIIVGLLYGIFYGANYFSYFTTPKEGKEENNDIILILFSILKSHRYLFMFISFLVCFIYASEISYPSNEIFLTLIYGVSALTVCLFVIHSKKDQYHRYFLASLMAISAILYNLARIISADLTVLYLYEKLFILFLAIFVWLERKAVLDYFYGNGKSDSKLYRFYEKILKILPWSVILMCVISLLGFSHFAWAGLSYIWEGVFYIFFLSLGFQFINYSRKKLKIYSLKHFKHGSFIASDVVSPLSVVAKIVWIWLVSLEMFSNLGLNETNYLVVNSLLIAQTPLITIGSSEITLQMIGLSVITLYLVFRFSRWIKSFSYNWIFLRIKDLGIRGSLSIFTQYIVTLFGMFVTLNILGIDLTSLAVFAGALGVGVGLGLQDIAKNFISGILLLIERPLHNGDWVYLDSYEGTVKSIGMRAIKVETFDKQEVVIPNANAISNSFINNTHSNSTLRIVLYVGASYDNEPKQVIDTLKKIMQENKDVLQSPEPIAFLWEYADSSINYRIQYHIDVHKSDRLLVRNEVLREIWYRFKENSIEIPYPQRDVHLQGTFNLGEQEIKNKQ